MRIEIKKLKHFEESSRETHCFEAIVYVNGTRSFMAGNNGSGGPNLYSPLRGKPKTAAKATFTKAMKKVKAHLKTLPKVEYYGHMLPVDLDSIIGDLISNKLVVKNLKRRMKTKVLGYVPSKGGVFEWDGPITAEAKIKVVALHKDVLFLDEMKDAEICKYYG